MAEWKELMLKEEKYTDAEVDVIVATHTAIAGAHHTKYTNAEAVAAVATADDYVKNTGDTMTGILTVDVPHTAVDTVIDIRKDGGGGGCYFAATAYRDSAYGGGFIFKHARGTIASPSNLAVNDYIWIISSRYYNGGFVQTLPIKHKYLGGSNTQLDITVPLNLSDQIMLNPKNHAASALSGTKKLVEIDIGGTPYYYEVYPTKA